MAKLSAPQGLVVNFKPSPKQWELWKLLQPNCCPQCGGQIEQFKTGLDRNGNPQFKPRCVKCGTFELPQMILGGGSAGGGKCLLLDSNVCTPFGFRKLSDIKIGDAITNPKTGGVQEVIWLHPIEEHEFYRIHFVDKTHTDCSEGHLWECHESRVTSKRVKKYGGSPNRVWSTLKMYEWYQKKKNGVHAGNNLIIPLTEPVKFSMGCHKPAVDPYVLGAIIGDGCITDSIIKHNHVAFSTMDQEIVDRFEEAGYHLIFVSQSAGNQSKNYIIKGEKLISEIKRLGIAGNRSQTHWIPREYKMASIEGRINLMQGLIDTDGYVDDRGHIIYTTTSEDLANDVAFIVRSLGGVATITRGPAGYKSPKTGEYVQCSDAFDVQIRTKNNAELCGVSRKKERAEGKLFNGGYSELGKRIVDIEYIGRQSSRCISVSDPSGLYVADNFTVTHNSYMGSAWMAINCMRFPGIRGVMARKTLKSLKASTFKTLLDILRDWGLKQDENFAINHVDGVLKFWNNSEISLAELEDLPSDPEFQRLGSNEWTIGMIDEASEVSEKAVEVLFSRLRYKLAESFVIPRLLMTTNPCLTWIRPRFVMDDDGNPPLLSESEAYVPFSVFDNPNTAFVATYRAALDKIKDKATKERLLYGNWDFVDTNEAAAYHRFEGDKHCVDNLREKAYNSLAPIIVSLDFNVMPYMSSLIFQFDFDKKRINVLEEVLGKAEDKENNSPKLAEKLKKKFLNEKHVGGLILTGDPAGLARSSQTEDGVNNFTIFMNGLTDSILRPRKKVLSKQPSQVSRLDFINALFEGYQGWKIQVDTRCRKLVEDFVYQKRNEDGTKEKKKYIDPKTKVKCEKYGHLSDCFDYAICTILNKLYNQYLTNMSGSVVVTSKSNNIYVSYNF